MSDPHMRKHGHVKHKMLCCIPIRMGVLVLLGLRLALCVIQLVLSSIGYVHAKSARAWTGNQGAVNQMTRQEAVRGSLFTIVVAALWTLWTFFGLYSAFKRKVSWWQAFVYVFIGLLIVQLVLAIIGKAIVDIVVLILSAYFAYVFYCYINTMKAETHGTAGPTATGGAMAAV